MDTNDYPLNENLTIVNNPQLVIDSTSANYLFSIMKKMKFVTIVAIVFLSLLVISGFASMLTDRFPASKIASLIYIIIGAVFIYVAKTVLSGISKTKQALMGLDNNSLHDGLKEFNTAATFQYVITIIYLVILVLVFLAPFIF